MHQEVFDFIRHYAATDKPVRVIEIGSRDVNGSVRPLFPNADYTGLDISPGPGIDVVGEVESYRPKKPADIVICCEVFEHAETWQSLCRTAYRFLDPVTGAFYMTCAGPGRHEHGACGGPLPKGEFYKNVSAVQLGAVLTTVGFPQVMVQTVGLDVQAIAFRTVQKLQRMNS